MKIQFFKTGYKKHCGVNVIAGKFELRIGGGQFAFWKNCNPFFNLLF